jgi:long-chain fatty acid transport protein
MAVVAGLAPAMAGAHGWGLPAASFAAGGTGLTSFYILGFELGPWQEYLAQELTPDYMLPDNVAPVRVSWLRDSDVLLLPDFASHLEPEADRYFYFNFEYQSAGDYLAPDVEPQSLFQGTLFERQFFSPGFEQQVSDSGVLGVAAVIAYQRFSAANLGLLSATTPESIWLPRSGFTPYEETGYGTGVRLALRQDVFDRFTLETGFQSRIDMEEFAAYRGVYSNPADLDIPARARVGLEFQATQRSWLNVAVERVLYSDINAFPSRYLPNRFLSLLGDSTSPTFDWEDLTVYTVGWSWSDGAKQKWHVDISTRQQPSPSSLLLSEAIESDLADSALIVGYSRQTGKNHRVNFNAAYAPSEFAFGGSVLGITTEELDQRFEVEAFWTIAF